MAAYINTKTFEFPRYIGDVIADSPSWTPDLPLPSGWAELHIDEPPTTSDTQTALYGTPTLDGTVYRVGFTIKELTDSELAKLNDVYSKLAQELGEPTSSELIVS